MAKKEKGFSYVVKGYSYMKNGKKVIIKPYIRNGRKVPYKKVEKSKDPIINSRIYSWKDGEGAFNFAKRQHRLGYNVFNMHLSNQQITASTKKNRLTLRDFQNHYSKEFHPSKIEEL